MRIGYCIFVIRHVLMQLRIHDFSIYSAFPLLLKRTASASKNLGCTVINWMRSRDISSRYVDPPRIYRRARADLSGAIRFISVSQARARWRSTRFRSRLANFVCATFRKNGGLFAVHDRFVDSICVTRRYLVIHLIPL